MLKILMNVTNKKNKKKKVKEVKLKINKLKKNPFLSMIINLMIMKFYLKYMI